MASRTTLSLRPRQYVCVALIGLGAVAASREARADDEPQVIVEPPIPDPQPVPSEETRLLREPQPLDEREALREERRRVRAPSMTEEAATDRARLTVAAIAMVAAGYPRSNGEGVPALGLGVPFWLGSRHRFFQWHSDVFVTAGVGVESGAVRLTAAPRFGFDLTFGRIFGVDFRMGVGAVGQIGKDTVAGAFLVSDIAYGFRFWDDDRQRLKILTFMMLGSYYAKDPGNDYAANASALGAGLAYETPF